jgi:hypothetical protein
VSALLTVLAVVGAWVLASILVHALLVWWLRDDQPAPAPLPRAPRYLPCASPHPQHHPMLWISAPDDASAWDTLERSA